MQCLEGQKKNQKIVKETFNQQNSPFPTKQVEEEFLEELD